MELSLLLILSLLLTTHLCVNAAHAPQHSDNHDGHHGSPPPAVAPANCTVGMFGGDVYAYRACAAQYALQRNWFPSPISGLFSYQVWNGFDGFWQNGAVLETVVNFMAYAGHERYVSVLTGSLRGLSALLLAYYPQPSYDDMGWYGLSYLRIYELLKDDQFLQTAKDIYDWNWNNGWDSSGNCSGGVWFDQGMNFKATITNAQMLQLGAKLYVLTGRQDAELLTKVHKTWAYIVDTKIVDPRTYRVADAIYLGNCTGNDNFGPTYSPGVLAVGLMYLSQINDEPQLLDLAHHIVNATIVYHSQEGVLTEDCDFTGCGDDNKVFKGIFVRSLRYLMERSDNVTKEYYTDFLRRNIDVMMANSSCKNAHECRLVYRDGPSYFNATAPVFSNNWHGPYNYSAPMQQASALDLLVSAIKPGTKCSGPACTYDPPIPPPMTLTCKNDPCPKGQDCCEHGGGYRTCCNPAQKCVKGFCE